MTWRLNMGERERLMEQLTVATRAWAAAGYPSSGPLVDARLAVFEQLRRSERPVPRERLWV